MIVKHYYKQKNIAIAEGLVEDRLTFSVLVMLLNNGVNHAITDHETYCIAYSADIFPVWIWIAKDLDDEQLKEIWQLAKKYYPPESGYNYNVSYDYAKWIFIFESQKANSFDYLMNLLCYECKQTIMPKRANHLELLTPSADDQVFIEAYTEEKIGKFHLLKSEDGKILSICRYLIDQPFAKIGPVYTPEELRCNGYAQRLIFLVTEKILAKNLRPILYTDADYEASNICYKRVGYQEVGAICTIGIKE